MVVPFRSPGRTDCDARRTRAHWTSSFKFRRMPVPSAGLEQQTDRPVWCRLVPPCLRAYFKTGAQPFFDSRFLIFHRAALSTRFKTPQTAR